MTFILKIPEHLDTYEFEQLRKDSRVDLNKYYEKPTPILKVDQNGSEIDVLTVGNISLIKGAAKSRKTFTMLYLVNKVLQNKSIKEVTIFDTEQYLWYSSLFLNRIKTMNEDYGLVKFYNIRKYSKQVRMQFIEDYIIHYRPTIVFIDNIRDVMVDFNDISQSDAVLTLLSQLCEEYKTHICVTLHVNKANDFARGHLGSELEQKCETVLLVSTANDVTTIDPVLTRNKSFHPITFSINMGIPEDVEVYNIGSNF